VPPPGAGHSWPISFEDWERSRIRRSAQPLEEIGAAPDVGRRQPRWPGAGRFWGSAGDHHLEGQCLIS
jgi:hypothetical protein